MSLKNELLDVTMMNNDTIASYFVRIYKIKDQIQIIGETIFKNQLVTTTLNCIPTSWDAFSLGISSWKEAHSFEQLWTSHAPE